MKRTLTLTMALLALAMFLEPARVVIRGEDAVPLLAAVPRAAPSIAVSSGGPVQIPVYVPCAGSSATGTMCLTSVSR